MIDSAIVLDIGVESGYHSYQKRARQRRVIFVWEAAQNPLAVWVFLNGNTSIFSRSISIFPGLIHV